MSKSILKTDQLLGVLLILALLLPHIPIISALSILSPVAVFGVAIYLLIK